MSSERGPIKVGSGYVEIVPKVPQKDMAELRGKITSELEKIGVAASKEMKGAVTKGLAGLPKEVQKQAQKAKQAVEGEAKDSAETITKLEKFVTKQYGEQSKKRLAELREFYEGYETLTEEASATTKKALRETVRQEEKAARDRTAAERERVREAERLAKEQQRAQEQAARETAKVQAQAARDAAKAQAQAARDAAKAQREAIRQQVADIRAQAAEQRHSIRQQISDQQRAVLEARTQIQGLRRSIADANASTASMFKRTETGLKSMGTWFHEVGVSITEAGNLLTTKFLAPLAMAGTALSTIGVTNADKRLLGQLGLTAAGVSPDQSAKQMRTIQQYAINTPYSIDVMHEYQMKLIRSVAGADKSWYSKDPGTRTKAANKAAGRTTDLIMAVGDSMARAGNLSPDMFQRAMYAMDMIMDMDRAPTRNVKQLASATGMPASELAHLLGFKNSTDMWKIIGTPAKDGGGVTGVQIANSMLNYWNPKKYKGRNSGSGSLGFAESMTSETITGRLQQMKERATFELGNLFIKESKGGKYQYSGLGEKIMGKRVPVTKRVYDKATHGFEEQTVGYRNEGGIINQTQDFVKKYAGKDGRNVSAFLGKFMDGVSRFLDTIDGIAGWFKEHPVFIQLGESIANFLLKWGPLIVGVGLLSKLIGKLLKVGSAALGPARAVGRGVLNAYDGVKNVRSQRQARNAAVAQARSNGASRKDARRAGRQAYRDQRTRNRGGDDRSAGRRTLDAVFGRQGEDTSAQQRNIRELEDQINQAQREAARLRDELRDVNHETMRQIADALGGNGTNSVQGAARQANQALGATHQAAGQINDVRLNQIDGELVKVKEKADSLIKGFKAASAEARTLNERKLGSLRAQQVETTTKRAGELEKAVKGAEKAVQALNGRSLASLRGHFTETTTKVTGTTKAVKDTSSAVDKLKVKSLKALKGQFNDVHDAAEKAHKMVGQGTGAGSLAGRVGLLNNRSLSKVTGAVDDLRKALHKAKDEGDGLDGALDRIGKKSPGGGGGISLSGKRKTGKKNARGGVTTQADVGRYGVMPGYAPWVDNIPAVLSPGESVLRPEVTHAIGPDRIASWNAMAVRGKISRNARGTGGRFNLDDLKNLMQLENVAPIGTAMLRTMQLDGTSDPLGGSTQGGILRTGDHSANFGGAVAADKFHGIYDWMTHDIYKFAKKAPTFVGQIAGILGGTLNPVLGDYFWDDVWKGSGNVVDRGKRYLGDVFSWKTLEKVWDNLWGGVGDSLGSIWHTATNPIDSLTGAFSDIGDLVSGSYNNVIDTISMVKEIRDSPLGYAGRVYDGFMEDAKAAMPNTKGLFDFSKGSKVKADVPDVTKLLSDPGSGKGVQRWEPLAKQVLAMLHLPASALPVVMHRIGVESGGNPNIVNNWDSNWKMGHPSVGLMQVIDGTFKRYAGPFGKTGPFKYGVSTNPMANLYAGLNYASNVYGSKWQSVLSGNKGYATGTLSASPGLAVVGEKGRELVAFGGGERVFNNDETEGLLNGKKYEIHIHEARTEPTPQAVLRALQTAEALYTNL
ncbi:transglycosylase SLT domain-containing protein [Streptomyces sp. NPDC004682]